MAAASASEPQKLPEEADCRACGSQCIDPNTQTKSYYSRCFVSAEFGVCKEPAATCGLFGWGVATQADRCTAWDYSQYSCTSSRRRSESRSDPQMRTVQPGSHRIGLGSKAVLYQDRAHDRCNR